MKTRLLCVALAIGLLFALHKIRTLNYEKTKLYFDKPNLWKDSCLRAVEESCYHADCAITPIEVIQEKVCGRIPDELYE